MDDFFGILALLVSRSAATAALCSVLVSYYFFLALDVHLWVCICGLAGHVKTTARGGQHLIFFSISLVCRVGIHRTNDCFNQSNGTRALLPWLRIGNDPTPDSCCFACLPFL
jgi:hypothetical protein